LRQYSGPHRHSQYRNFCRNVQKALPQSPDIAPRKALALRYARGCGAAFSQQITQANEDCDVDFLKAEAETSGPESHRPRN